MTNRDRLDAQWQLLSGKFPKFSVASHQRFSGPLLIELEAEPASKDQNYQEASAYHAYLLKLSDEELERDLQNAIALKQAEREARHPFNQPDALATDEVFEFWSRAELWTLGEAAALINGRDPAIVTETRIESVPRDSKIGVLLTNTLELLERARMNGTLYRTNGPTSLIGWAELKAIQMPQKLVELTLERSKTSSTVSKENKILKERLATLEAKNDNVDGPENSSNPDRLLGARERESLLKLLLGMAINGYRYDPKATRSQEIKEIANDLRLANLPLDEDTVRKYLNEAKALFSDELNRT